MSSVSSFTEVEPVAGADDLAEDGFSLEPNGRRVDFAVLDGPIPPEEGYALREWRRQNAIRLTEKEKEEKELLRDIIEEAEVFKADFTKKWKLRCHNNKASNRDKEKLYLASLEKFHSEASKAYWKAIDELIPKEVATIEKKGKKEQAKKPSVVVIQGPKPGKPTELSRMRHLLVKLKHNPPPYVKPPLASSEPGKDANNAPLDPATSASVAMVGRGAVGSA